MQGQRPVPKQARKRPPRARPSHPPARRQRRTNSTIGINPLTLKSFHIVHAQSTNNSKKIASRDKMGKS